MNKIIILLILITGLISNAQTHELADEYWSKGLKAKKTKNWENAAIFFELSAEAEKNTLKPRLENLTIGLANAASCYKQKQNFIKSIKLLEELLDLIEIEIGINIPLYGTILNNLSGSYKAIKDYDKALHLSQKALENAKNTLGKDHPNYRTYLKNLAGLYEAVEEYDYAILLYKQAMENTEISLGKGHADYGILLNNLAGIYMTIGKYKMAGNFYTKALKNAEETHGKVHSTYSNRLGNLANFYAVLGHYEKALPLHIEALENTKKLLGKEHADYGIRLNNLSGLYQVMGQYQKALPLKKEALRIAKKTLGRDHSDYGIFINNLASLYVDLLEYKKALPLYLEALDNNEKILGKEHSEYGNKLNNLAFLYKEMGEFDKALSLYLEALENVEKTLGKEHTNYGISLNNLAVLYETSGKYEKALPLQIEALENTKKLFGKEHANYGIRLNNLARLLTTMGQHQKALQIYIERLDNTILQIEQNFSFQNEEGKDIFIKNRVGSGLNNFSNFNFVSKNNYSQSITYATNNILTSKGLLLSANKDILSQLQNIKSEKINEKVILFKAIKTSINLQQQLPIRKRDSSYKKQFENYEALGREITKLHSLHFGEEINHIKNWQRNKLEKNELAIEFTHFKVHNKKWTDSTFYVAYLYRKDWKSPKVVNLFEEKQLKQHLSQSSNPKNLYKIRGSEGSSTIGQLAVADSIYKLIWKPLEKYIETSSTIYFSPDGLLHKIPFAALPNKDGKLIGEIYDINQVGNTADVNSNSKKPDLKDALLIGGITYDYKIETSQRQIDTTYSIMQSDQLLGNVDNRNVSSNGFVYLPGTRKEINDINSVLKNSLQLTGSYATESAFKELSGKSPSILHIATHGFFLPKLSEDKKTDNYASNPLLRSGLLFANANYAWKNGYNPYEKDDGILTALEISNLDLSNTDIVILSACETGLGDIVGSEGVYGLQRAFKMAGVNTIIMSLWEVPDAETAEFMNLFYKQWKKLDDSKEAFKKAQKVMMNKYRNEPQKWAAFVYFE